MTTENNNTWIKMRRLWLLEDRIIKSYQEFLKCIYDLKLIYKSFNNDFTIRNSKILKNFRTLES